MESHKTPWRASKVGSTFVGVGKPITEPWLCREQVREDDAMTTRPAIKKGDRVRYWPGARLGPPNLMKGSRVGVTESDVTLLSGHTEGVYLRRTDRDGHMDFIALTHIDGPLLPLNPRSHYICPDGIRKGHSSLYTGSLEYQVAGDGWCVCGKRMVEDVDDGTRWRVTFETDTGGGWHEVKSEHASEALARSQMDGLRKLEADGEPVRGARLDRAAVGWETVDA